MSKQFVRSMFPVGLAACVLASGPTGCKKEEKAAEGEGAAAAEPAEAAGAEAKAPAAPAAPRIARLAVEGGVLGHVLFPNGRDLLAKLQQKVMVGASAAAVNEGVLRTMAGGWLGDKKQLADNVRLDAPLGCAAVDFKTFAQPLACVFAYKGGLAQLEKDLGAGSKQADAAGHAAHFKVAGTDVFVDPLGEHLAVATDAKVLDAAKGYLEKNLVGRATAAAGDLEVVAYPAKIFEIYRAEAEALLAELAKDTKVSSDIKDPQLRKAMEIWTAYNVESTRNTFTQLLQLEQVVFAMGIDDAGLRIRFGMVPAPDSTMAKEQQAAFSRPVDPAFAAKLPEDVVAVMAARRDVAAANAMESTEQAVEAMTKAYATWTGKDPAKVRAAYDAAIEKMIAHFGEHQALGVLAGGDVPIGIVALNETKDAGARDVLREIFEKLTPETFLPEQAQGYVTWSYAAGGAKAGGVELDRITFELGPKAVAAAEAEVKKDPDLAKLRDFFGGWKIVVDSAYLDGAQITVWAPKAEEAAAAKAIAAYRGEGALGRGPVDAIARNDGRSWMLAGANVGGILAAIRKIAPDELKALPEKLGGDLDDVVLTGTVADGGISEYQLVFKQSFVDDVRKAIEAAQQKGAAGQAPLAPAGGGGAQP